MHGGKYKSDKDDFGFPQELKSSVAALQRGARACADLCRLTFFVGQYYSSSFHRLNMFRLASSLNPVPPRQDIRENAHSCVVATRLAGVVCRSRIVSRALLLVRNMSARRRRRCCRWTGRRGTTSTPLIFCSTVCSRAMIQGWKGLQMRLPGK